MKRVLIVTAVAVGQLALASVAVFPQLSARVAGDTYQMRVMPVDPIDPFRGAYVALDYPDLRRDDSEEFGDAWSSPDDGEQGDLFITLAQRGDVWVGADWTRERPESGPYLACNDRSWRIECGIDSFFLPQDEALEMEKAVTRGDVIAEVRIDGRGNASVVGLTQP